PLELPASRSGAVRHLGAWAAVRVAGRASRSHLARAGRRRRDVLRRPAAARVRAGADPLRRRIHPPPRHRHRDRCPRDPGARAAARVGSRARRPRRRVRCGAHPRRAARAAAGEAAGPDRLRTAAGARRHCARDARGVRRGGEGRSRHPAQGLAGTGRRARGRDRRRTRAARAVRARPPPARGPARGRDGAGGGARAGDRRRRAARAPRHGRPRARDRSGNSRARGRGAAAGAGAAMRVAHLDTGREWRGGQRQVLLLMEGLARRGHDVRLLAPRGPLLERARAAGIESREWRPGGEWDLFAMLDAAGALRAWRPDLAHAHSAHAHALGVPAARLAGVPGVVVSRRVDFAIATQPFSRLKYRMPVDRYFCISAGVEAVMRAGGVPESKLARVPSGVELPSRGAALAEAVSRRSLREELGLAADVKLVGTVAALAPHKDHATLLEAAALVTRARDDVHFVWAGEGECRPALERRRRELGLESRVHLLGFRDDPMPLQVQLDLFVLAFYLEGLGTALLDAQALGLPIVATAVGGITDVIENGVNGRLVPPRDPEALAAAIEEALSRPDLAAAWADRG